ncbi:unnamed protein product [Dimorphilus gyrociliatus]|uniref:Uncharacterized protein n=1 Tax=Dimorphilus gyrociliatus TaxID=2664684 RepID=A0A7I8W7U5_9ANNE|nr:unnamed protein product [Dimorphilus gyrociliatus]
MPVALSTLKNKDWEGAGPILKEYYENIQSGSKLEEDDLDACVDATKHYSLEIRSLALRLLSYQYQKNVNDEHVIKSIVKSLRGPNLLDLRIDTPEKESEDNNPYVLLHNNLTLSIGLLQEHAADHLMPIFKPVALYIANSLKSNILQIRLGAVNYLRQLQNPPVPSQCLSQWSSAFLSVLDQVIPSLIDNIAYADDLVEYTINSNISLNDIEPPKNINDLSNLRNWSALAFENLASLLQTDVALAAKGPISSGLTSRDWKKTEASLLVTAAFCQSVSSRQPRVMKDIYDLALSTAGQALASTDPLLKAGCCFALQTLHCCKADQKTNSEWWTKLMKASPSLLSDHCAEVRESSLRALTSVLAYGNRDISSYAQKLSSGLRKSENLFNGSGRFTFFECCVHLVARCGIQFDDEGSSLLRPLVDYFLSLQLTSVPVEELLLVVQPICLAAIFSGPVFSNYRESIVVKIQRFLCQDFNGNWTNQEDENRFIAIIDTVSACLESSTEPLPSLITDKLSNCIIRTLKKENPENILQSSIAFVGNLSRTNWSAVKQHSSELIKCLEDFSSSSNQEIRSNSYWTLLSVVNNIDECCFGEEFISNLTENIKKKEEDFSSMSLLVTISERWPKMGKARSLLTTPDTFQVICKSLRRDWPREEDRIRLVEGLCKIIGGKNVRWINKDCWEHFLVAMATMETKKETSERIRQTLHDARASLGNATWSRLMQQMGTKGAFALRKKYQLY